MQHVTEICGRPRAEAAGRREGGERNEGRMGREGGVGMEREGREGEREGMGVGGGMHVYYPGGNVQQD